MANFWQFDLRGQIFSVSKKAGVTLRRGSPGTFQLQRVLGETLCTVNVAAAFIFVCYPRLMMAGLGFTPSGLRGLQR